MMQMLTTNLTQPVSKKLFLAILIITIGAEVDLYFSRYSNLASSLYDGMMVASLFIGVRLFPRLKNHQAAVKTKRQLGLQLTGAFLIFFLSSTVINMYSSYVFQDFSNDYDQYVQSTSDSQHIHNENTNDPMWSFFDKVDTIGYDFYSDALAGLEEVWRLAYMVFILIILKKMFPGRWENGSRDLFLLFAFFLTSIMFGIDHTLDTEQAWSVKIGAIVTFANMGFVFGLIQLWTRNLWVAVAVHSIYDITTTISWYFFDYALETLAAVVLILHVILLVKEKRKKNELDTTGLTDPVQMAE